MIIFVRATPVIKFGIYCTLHTKINLFWEQELQVQVMIKLKVRLVLVTLMLMLL